MDDAGASFATPCVLVIVFPFGKNLSNISRILTRYTEFLEIQWRCRIYLAFSKKWGGGIAAGCVSVPSIRSEWEHARAVCVSTVVIAFPF